MTDEKPATLALPLSAADVCAILKSCRQNQVVSLSFGGLQVEFLRELPELQAEAQFQSSRVRAAKVPKLTEEIVEKGELEQRSEVEQSRLDLLAVEDPVAYEKFLHSEDAETLSSTDDDD